jgi:hypothetical protein
MRDGPSSLIGYLIVHFCILLLDGGSLSALDLEHSGLEEAISDEISLTCLYLRMESACISGRSLASPLLIVPGNLSMPLGIRLR